MRMARATEFFHARLTFKGSKSATRRPALFLFRKRRQHRTWLSGEKEERDALRCETALHHLQSPQHERILAGRCTKELRRQAEDHCERGTVTQRQVLSVEERPVVADPLVPAHPVDHGPAAGLPGRRMRTREDQRAGDGKRIHGDIVAYGPRGSNAVIRAGGRKMILKTFDKDQIGWKVG